MKKAYSYQRFSSIKQREGDSLKRQAAAAQAFCTQHGLQLVSTLKDEGISGFKGKNFTNESALGQFLRLVHNGTVEPGSILIIENMDRLSRQSILPCLSKFMEIIHQGVSIGVLSLNKILDEDSITRNPMDLMLVLVEFVRANNESQAKSIRAKSVIQAKIERAKKGEKIWFGVIEPTWIKGIKDGEFILDTPKVQIVKDIFKLYLAGDSCNNIANTLNKLRVPTLRELRDGIWTNSTVADVIRNRNVIGWFGINGNEFDDYFPAIVTAKDFQDAQNKLSFNAKNRGGSKYGLVRNLFKGLLYCAECGQAIETKIGQYKNVKGLINHYSDYICRGVKQKTGCNNKGRVNTAAVELAIFENVLFKHPSSLTTIPKTNNDKLSVLEQSLTRIQSVIERLTDMASDPELKDASGLKNKLREAVTEEGELKKKIDQEKTAESRLAELPAVGSTLKSLLNSNNLHEVSTRWSEEYRAFMVDPDKRKKLRSLMYSIFERISLKFSIINEHFVTDIECRLISGELITARLVKYREGLLFATNDPATKKSKSFKLLKDGTRIPIES